MSFQFEPALWNSDIFSNMSSTQLQSTNSVVSTDVKVRCSSGSSSGSSELSSSKLPVKCDRYKTELCRTYEENGTCRYGDKCQFAHGVAELRTVNRHPKYKTDLCRTFHTTGFCPYGSRCHFIHSLQERQLPVQQPSRIQLQAANLLLPQLAVKSNQIPSAQTYSQTMVRPTEKQPVDSLLLALSSLLQAKQFAADQTSINILAHEQARKLATSQMAAEFLPNSAVPQPQGLTYFSDTTSISTDSASPCPSPTSLSGIHDDFTFGSCYTIKSNPHVQQNTGFQSPIRVPAGILTPPGSPGSVASSLNSVFSDYESCDWPRSVWPALMSPPRKGVDVSLIPDFAHSQLLMTKHSVFA